MDGCLIGLAIKPADWCSDLPHVLPRSQTTLEIWEVVSLDGIGKLLLGAEQVF